MNGNTLLFAGLLTGAALLGNAADFFRTDEDPGKDLPADKIYPQGRIFPYTGFQPRNVAMLKDAGFTMAGPGYGRKHIIVLSNEAKKLNFPFVYTIAAEGITKENLANHAKIDWEKIRKDVARQVKDAAASYPNIAWWYLQPEELRFWRPNEYRYLKEVYETIRNSDPLKRPVWMYNPNHYDLSALQKYVPYMDIMGKGMYTSHSGNREQRSWGRWSSENQVRAIQECKSDAVPICVPEMFEEHPVALVGKYVRHDVFLSLICGSKGVVIFSIAERPSMSKAVHQAYLNAYSKVAKELKLLGEVFLFGLDRRDLKGVFVSGPSEQNITLAGRPKKRIACPTMTYCEKLTKSGRYLFAVNSAETPLVFRFEKLPVARILDALTNREIAVCENGALELKFEPLEVKLLKLVRK